MDELYAYLGTGHEVIYGYEDAITTGEENYLLIVAGSEEQASEMLTEYMSYLYDLFDRDIEIPAEDLLRRIYEMDWSETDVSPNINTNHLETGIYEIDRKYAYFCGDWPGF